MHDATKEINLAELGLFRPTRIDWVFVEPNEKWISGIQSKSIRKIASALDEILQSAELTVEQKPLTQELFVSWLEFYTVLML